MDQVLAGADVICTLDLPFLIQLQAPLPSLSRDSGTECSSVAMLAAHSPSGCFPLPSVAMLACLPVLSRERGFRIHRLAPAYHPVFSHLTLLKLISSTSFQLPVSLIDTGSTRHSLLRRWFQLDMTHRGMADPGHRRNCSPHILTTSPKATPWHYLESGVWEHIARYRWGQTSSRSRSR